MGELIAVSKREDVKRLDQAARETALAIKEAKAADNQFALALVTARGLQSIRESLTPAIMQDLYALMNSPLGYLTDRGPEQKRDDRKEPYPVDTVRDCMIQAITWGCRPVGNEINILSGRAYRTKEYWERMVKEFPGLAKFRERFGLPEIKDGAARVPVVCTWELDGKPDEFVAAQTKSGEDWRIVVRVNSGMGDDALIGKAKKRAYQRIYAQLSNMPIDEDEPDSEAIDIEPIEAAPRKPAKPDTSAAGAVDHLAIALNKLEHGAKKAAWAYISQNGTEAEKKIVGDKIAEIESIEESRR